MRKIHRTHLTYQTYPGYFTACFSAFPAAKRGTRRLGTLIVAPVCGLRALRALRLAVLNVPNPTNETGSPFFSDFVMPSISESMAAAAVVFVRPVSLAILTITSCLFMNPPVPDLRRGGANTAGGRFVRNAQRLYHSYQLSVVSYQLSALGSHAFDHEPRTEK